MRMALLVMRSYHASRKVWLVDLEHIRLNVIPVSYSIF
jgi:hypothetical protein